MKGRSKDKELYAEHQIKTLLKNGLIFQRLLWNTKTEFVKSLADLIKKWPSPYRKSPLGYAWNEKSYQTVRRKSALATNYRDKYFSSLDDKKLSEFMLDIEQFVRKYNLGQEWHLPFIDYIICYWLYPPQRNFYLSEHRDKDRQRVVLTLNPDTSLKDIEAAWPIIKEQQTALWPAFKKQNLTKKSYSNHEVVKRDLREKIIKGAEKDIVTNTIYKLNDQDIADKVFNAARRVSKKTHQKQMNRLRQIRSRFKRR